MPKLNLDTHVLIHALQGDITPRERRVLTTNTWGVSAIVLWELAKLSVSARDDSAQTPWKWTSTTRTCGIRLHRPVTLRAQPTFNIWGINVGSLR